jgi:hypothetical protein
MPYALLTDPAAPGHVYAGLGNGAVWQSHDHGDTWRRLPFTLDGIRHTLLLLRSTPVLAPSDRRETPTLTGIEAH